MEEQEQEQSDLIPVYIMGKRYMVPPTLTIMQAVRDWRSEGLEVCYTLDAGPNVHCLCIRKDAEQVSQRLKMLSGVLDVRTANVGGPAAIISSGER